MNNSSPIIPTGIILSLFIVVFVGITRAEAQLAKERIMCLQLSDAQEMVDAQVDGTIRDMAELTYRLAKQKRCIVLTGIWVPPSWELDEMEYYRIKNGVVTGMMQIPIFEYNITPYVIVQGRMFPN